MGGHRAHRGSHVYPHLISLICTDCHGEDQGGDHTPPMASCCSFTQEEWLECYKKGGQPRMLHLKPSSASRRRRNGSPARKFVHSAWTEEGSSWRKVLRRAGTWSRADSALLPTTERRRQSAGTSQWSGLLGAC